MWTSPNIFILNRKILVGTCQNKWVYSYHSAQIWVTERSFRAGGAGIYRVWWHAAPPHYCSPSPLPATLPLDSIPVRRSASNPNTPILTTATSHINTHYIAYIRTGWASECRDKMFNWGWAQIEYVSKICHNPTPRPAAPAELDK